MPRIRTIKPEFPQSESMGRVSRDARLLFIQLWTLCDDSGRARGSSRMLASLLFPYDDDAPKLMDRWMGELEREGCVVRYQIEGDNYFECLNWLKHQKIDKPSPSKIASPLEASRIVAKPRERSSEDQGPRIKERIKDQGQSSLRSDSSAEPSALAPASIPPVILLPTNLKSKEYPVSEADVGDYLETYPAVDIRQQLREMRRWAMDNPTKRKTYKGMPAFINKWLSKEQNKPHVTARNGKSNGLSPHDKFLAGGAAFVAKFDDNEGGTPGESTGD